MSHMNECNMNHIILHIWMTIWLIWLIHMWSMNHLYAWYDTFNDSAKVCTHAHVWHDAVTCVTWLIHTWKINHLYVWDDTFICRAWLVDGCAWMRIPHIWMIHNTYMNESCAWFILQIWMRDDMCDICVTRNIHVCDMTCVVAHILHMNDSYYIYEWVIWVIDITHMNETMCVTHMCDMNYTYMWYDAFIRWAWLIDTCVWMHVWGGYD